VVLGRVGVVMSAVAVWLGLGLGLFSCGVRDVDGVVAALVSWDGEKEKWIGSGLCLLVGRGVWGASGEEWNGV
jgi:hypothetical protein